MDVKKFFEKKIEKKSAEYREIKLRAENKIAEYEVEKQFVATSATIPEKTDTLQKLQAANGKKVIFLEKSGSSETATLDFTGTRIQSEYVSYPIIGDEDSGLRKITTIEGDEVVFDNPYTYRSSIYQTAMLLGRQAGLEEADAKIGWEKHSIEYREKDLQDLKDAEAKVPAYVERGSKLIYPQQKEKWEECVCYRLADLYRGAELENALQIMEALDNGATVEEAGKLLDDAGHSGMSYGVAMSIVLSFSKRGVEFCKANHSSYKYAVKNGDTETVAKWGAKFAEVEAQNATFAKAEKTSGDGKGGQGGKN